MIAARLFLGVLYAEWFAPDEAREQFESALALAQELRSPTWIQAILGALAGAYLHLEDHKSAQSCLESAISPQTSMDTVGKRYCWLQRAELALAQGDPALALDITERLIASAPGMSPEQVITFLWKLKGEALAAIGSKEEALHLLHDALENAKAAEERFLLWRVHACLGRLYQDLGRQDLAEKEIESAQAIVDEMAVTMPDERLKAQFRKSTCRILEIPLKKST